MERGILTDDMVEKEIERLRNSDTVKLAKMEERIRNKRRKTLYQLRSLDKKGKALQAKGITLENIFAVMADDNY